MIPEGVTAIWLDAFSGAKNLEYVSLPSTLQSIMGNAFKNCNLKEIVLPENLVTLWETAFYNCERLRAVVIPKKTTLLGNCVFAGCTNLTDIYLPRASDSVKKLDIKQIQNPRITIHIEKDSLEEEYYKNENHGLQVDYEGPSHYTPKPLRTITDYANPEDFVIEGKKLIWFRGAARNIVIPENVTIIGEKAFAGRAFIEHVFLHEHVTAIEDSAFELCDALQTINLPVSIKKIGEDIFSGCCSLKTICIPDSIKSLRDGLNRNFVYGAKQDVYLPPTIGSLASHAINTSRGMTYHVIAGSKIETILKNRRDKQSDSFAIDNDVGDAWTDNPLGEDPKLIARYHAAEKAVKIGQLRQAESIFRELMGFKDSRERASMCAEIIRKETIAKKTKLLNEKIEQEKILAENKGLGAIFGEKAKKRKAAQQRLEEINKELERL